ncbi:MAG: ATP-binding protein [Bacteroidales bacterium]|nr:ATP-binding protein [Bacteroidales bacterium]
MQGYFPYLDYVSGKDFIGRETTSLLISNYLERGENVLVYDAPHSGKTSVINHALSDLRRKQNSLVTCCVSLGNVLSGKDFIKKLVGKVSRTLSVPDAEALTDSLVEEENFDKAVSLAAEVSDDLFHTSRIVVVIEEFQALDRLDCAEKIYKAFAAALSGKSSCSWLITGSSINVMKYLFRVRTVFAGTLTRVVLPTIDPRQIVEYVIHTFNSTGKVIPRELALEYVGYLRSDMWYVNHLMSICDSLTRGYVNDSVIRDAMRNLLFIHNPRFRSEMASLTGFQINCLKAILDGHTHLTSVEVINRYGLNSSANTIRVREALMKKELIAFDDDNALYVIDPLFEYWLRNDYFGHE